MTDRELDEALAPLRALLRRRGTAGFEKHLTIKTKHTMNLEVNLMASIDFENLKQKLTETAGAIKDKTVAIARDVADKSSDAARTVAGKARNVAEKAKLNAEISSERENMKKLYTQLGKLYYEKYSAAPDPDLAESVTAVTEALERVAEKQARIDALDAAPEEAEEEAETVPEEETVVDEVEDTVEAAAETAADIAEEAAAEAKKTYEDTVSTVNTPQE